MGEMRKIGVLWAKTSAKGTKFYSGKLDAEGTELGISFPSPREYEGAA